MTVHGKLTVMLASISSSLQEDFYRVIVLNDRSQDYHTLITLVKLAFVEYAWQVSCKGPACMFGE